MFYSGRCVFCRTFSLPSFNGLRCKLAKIALFIYLMLYWVECRGPGKHGHIVADTWLPMMFLGLRKLENICCGHKIFLNKIRNIFCVPDTKFVSTTNVASAGKRGNICVGNNVFSFARALWHHQSLICIFYTFFKLKYLRN